MFRKPFFLFSAYAVSALALQGCSTNAATGKQQFTALMPPQQEASVGAQEHKKIQEQFGFYKDPALASYVQSIGSRVTQKTERPDVDYKFFILDSPIVNAFALPGGYIYVSRGLLALANNEAQVAAVLSHEAGHITGRHSAERYSRGVVTTLGAGLISAAIGSQAASQAISLGTNLYMSSYSQSQENEADTLGLRYMTQGGYDPDEMAAFLSSLQAQSGLDARLAGQSSSASGGYFSTHPATGDRVRKTASEAQGYQDSDYKNRDAYLQKIKGMVYGDSEEQGFTRDQTFYHPKIGFALTAPNGYRIVNQSNQIVITENKGDVILFDLAARANGQSAANYLTQSWLKDRLGLRAEKTTVNGMNAVTAAFDGTVNNAPVSIRVMVIEFAPDKFARFQIAIPKNASAATLEDLRRASYSFRRLSNSEKQSIKPYTLRLVTAKSGDSIASLASAMPFSDYKEERFIILNGLLPNEALVSGRTYKTIVK